MAAINIDSSFGVFPQALLIHEKRAEILANNLVNENTPGFQAQDIDFRQALKTIQSKQDTNQELRQSKSGHFANNVNAPLTNMQYRTVTQPSLDGNTVDGQIEQTEFSENALRYQATIRFLDSRIQGLLLAIKGTR